MGDLTSWIRGVGGLHLLLIVANLLLPRKLRTADHLPCLPPLLRQIFIVHSIYIVLVLAGFAALCFAFAPELAGGSALGRSLSAGIALFWILRVPIQLFYYDPEERRKNRFVDVGVLFVMLFIGAVLGWAAWRGPL